MHKIRLDVQVDVFCTSVLSPVMDRAVPTPAQVRAARALLGWKQVDLADRSKVHRNTIARYEAGVGAPLPVVLSALRQALEESGITFITRSAGETGVVHKPPSATR